MEVADKPPRAQQCACARQHEGSVSFLLNLPSVLNAC